MSLRSYRRNVALGVTGARKPTCLPAALEQISPDHKLPPATYKSYRGFIRRLDVSEVRRANAQQREMLDEILPYLGGISCRDLELARVKTCLDFRRLIRELASDEYRVAVQLDLGWRGVMHTVGLLPVEEDRFKLVSNHVPRALAGVVTPDQIFPRLEQPQDYPTLTKFNRFVMANVLALPLV